MVLFTIWKNRILKFVDNPIAIFSFLKKRFYYDLVADSYLQYYNDAKFLSYEETINTAIYQNKSLVRFGDELFDMLQGIGLYFEGWRQKYSQSLAKRLKEVISSDDERLLICYNPELIFKTKEQFKEGGIADQYTFWTNSKVFLRNYLHQGMVYGSALCFHPRYNTTIDFKKLNDFFSKKDIIILTSNTKRFEGMVLGKTTTFIEAPGSDAWQQYDFIYQKVLKEIEHTGTGSENILVLVSMGSAAKVLVYDLMKAGYTAWDTGQFFDLAATKLTESISF